MSKQVSVSSVGGRVFLAGVVASTLMLAHSPEANAQASRLPGVIDRPVRDYVPPALREQTAEALEREEPDIPLPPDADEVLAKIDSIEFEGNTVLGSDLLKAVVAPYTGRDLTKGDIARLKYELRKAYYDRGYVLVQAVTPPQDLSDAVLDVRIVEARIGKVILQNTALNDGLANHYADRLPVGEVFRERPVESAVSDVTALGNVESSITLQPGEQVGETDVVLDISEADEDVQSFSIYNYGSDLTGSWVANIDLQKSNMLGLGETLGLGLRKSEDDLEAWSLDANTPIGVGNTMLEFRYLTSENEIGDRLAALDSSGESDVLSLALSSAIVNTRALKTTVRFGAENRTHESFLGGLPETEDNISQLFLEGTAVQRIGSRVVTYGSLRFIKGISAGADEIGEADATRILGDPEATIIRANAFLGFYPSPDSTFTVGFFAQNSSDVLLSSDLFAIGGYGSVRGHSPAQETGESGYQVNLQYRYRWDAPAGWNFYTGVFYDYGKVSNELPDQTLDDTLKGTGVSLELANPADDLRVTLDWATAVGSYNNPEADDDQLYFRLTKDF